MPRKLFDEFGNEVEVPTPEELETSSKTLKELQDSIADLSADEGNRNWKQVRENIKTLKDALKEKGINTDDNGNIIQGNQFKPEDIEKMVGDKVNKTLIDRELNKALASYKEEDQKIVKHYFDKITSGEELTPENVNKYIVGAARAAMPESQMTPVQKAVAAGNSGGLPIDESNKSNFSETEEGKGLAGELGLTLEAPKQ